MKTYTGYWTQDGRMLTVEITEEGVIMDAYDLDARDVTEQVCGTVWRTFEEWWEMIAEGRA